MGDRSRTVCKHYHVFGRVQGVWFRGTARDQARRLGIRGWVRNCDDGSVEAVARGTPDAIEAFKTWLHEGPPSARVDRVEETDVSDPPKGDDFDIRS